MRIAVSSDEDTGVAREVVAELRARGHAVVGEAGTVDEAVATAAAQRPTAVLLDVNLPGTDGPAGAPLLRSAAEPPPRVLLMSAEVETVPADVIRTAGAVGFVRKVDLAVTDLAVYLSG